MLSHNSSTFVTRSGEDSKNRCTKRRSRPYDRLARQVGCVSMLVLSGATADCGGFYMPNRLHLIRSTEF